MLTPKQLTELYDAVARTFPGLQAALTQELARTHEHLTDALDGDQLRRAQGRAQLLRELIRRLTLPT